MCLLTSGTEADGEVAWSCRPDAGDTWATMRKHRGLQRWQTSIGSPRRAPISRKPSRGEGRLSPPVPAVFALAQLFFAREPGCMRPPGLPRALTFPRGQTLSTHSSGARARRENAEVYLGLASSSDLRQPCRCGMRQGGARFGHVFDLVRTSNWSGPGTQHQRQRPQRAQQPPQPPHLQPRQAQPRQPRQPPQPRQATFCKSPTSSRSKRWKVARLTSAISSSPRTKR